MRKVKIKEQAWIARIAARKLGYTHIAMVIGRTIYLHNTPVNHFLGSPRWILHELKHVEQFEEHGFIPFLYKYLVEYLRNGYYQNRFEIEARKAEKEDRLLLKYELLVNTR